MKHTKSQRLFERARQIMPGGVNSPVRAFKGVGGTPIFIRKAKGCTLTDVDGNDYIDYIGSWGPMILGHGHLQVQKAIGRAVRDGISFGAPTELEVQMAELVCEAFPAMEKVRFVNSGTEAVMGAVRVARGFTKRSKIIKFDGCYHGHADYLLVKAGSGAATLGTPDSAGVPASFAQETLIAKLNDIASVEEHFKNFPKEIAAILIEPIVGNMGVIVPRHDFLKKLQTICDREGALLILDEVMTGFRVALGGAQELYGIQADITTLGKIIGGGLPVGAYGARQEIMDCVAPAGPVYQAGTLSGNPVAMAAGLETLQILRKKKPYAELNDMTLHLSRRIQEAANRFKIPCHVERVGSMFTIFFTKNDIRDADSARSCDTKCYGKFFHAMLERGIYLAPSQFEACFVSIAHGKKEIEKTIQAATEAFGEIA